MVGDQDSRIRIERGTGRDAEPGRDTRDRKHRGILGEEQLVDASPERCVYASRETCNVRARCTSSEALTIVKSVT